MALYPKTMEDGYNPMDRFMHMYNYTKALFHRTMVVDVAAMDYFMQRIYMSHGIQVQDHGG